MNTHDERFLISLAKKEGWEILKNEEAGRGQSKSCLSVDGTKFPLVHPYQIHLILYRDKKDVGERLDHMHKAHDYLWPDHAITWNYWQERTFLAHLEGKSPYVLAGGAGIAKSMNAAKIAALFWLADPRRRGCLIASTTIESVKKRIWGYLAKLISQSALRIPAKVLSGMSPAVRRPGEKSDIYGIFAAAIRQGEQEKKLSTVIGRHPEGGFLVVLDEATDIDPEIMAAVPNWQQGTDFFQLILAGNSNSKFDCHGSAATPRLGWDSIDPNRDFIWETSYQNGICLYFNPYDSPAIHEKDPIKKAALSKFLITSEGIEEKKREYGEDTESFFRFVLGFWRSKGMDATVASEQFLTENEVYKNVEWAGFMPLMVFAGLDPAYQFEGMGCVLRLGILGQRIDGLMAIDFRKEELLFRIDTRPGDLESGELQLCRNVLKVLKEWNCPVSHLAVDISGSGRALADLIRIVSGESEGPVKIVSANKAVGATAIKSVAEDPNMFVLSPSEMWFRFRSFVQGGQIGGLDQKTIGQIVNRMVKLKNNKMLIETKKEYRARMAVVNPILAHSPDEADATILALYACIIRLGFREGQRREVPVYEDELWKQKLFVYQLERSRDVKVEERRRPALIPNFSGGLEDVVDGKNGKFL